MEAKFNYQTHEPSGMEIRHSKWLLASLSFVVIMIFLGGLTRLTHAGLSITEWQLFSGVFPPFSDLDWHIEFAKYKESLEYNARNFGMSLDEFQFIFWLEFVHRLMGRLTGLVYLLPLIYFIIRASIAKSAIKMYFYILVLFAAQGYMGWYMVKSGLIDQPYVSHFRLAAHLIIAFAIYGMLFWQWLNLSNQNNLLNISKKPFKRNTIHLLSLTACILLYLQVIIGGLTAGLGAGLVYNSFPMMGDNFIANEIKFADFNISSFSDAIFVQFLHRTCAYLLALNIVILSIKLLGSKNQSLIKLGYCIFLALLLQMLLGVFTLLYAVPITLALAHQLGAVLLLSFLLVILKKSKKAQNHQLDN